MHEVLEWHQEHKNFVLPALDPIPSYFSIPWLDDKPQDPIIQSIQLSAQTQRSPSYNSPSPSPRPSHRISCDKVPSTLDNLLWDEPSLLARPREFDRSKSWDPNFPLDNRKMPFLTEQRSSLLLNRVQPSFHSKTTRVAHITKGDLFNSLHLVVLGTPSPPYLWDEHLQSFVQAPSDVSHTGTSQSILKRLLDLGTLVRRLDQLVQELRERRGRANTTIHAFAHGLSSALTYVRNRLSRGPLSNHSGSSSVPCLATVWFYYADMERVMMSLASMCSRDMNTAPDRFLEIPWSPIDILSHLYETFEKHVEQHSSRDVIAIMAYFLTVSSRPYIQALCRLLAYGEAHEVHAIAAEAFHPMDATFQFENDEAENFCRGQETSIDADGPFPKFIPENLASILPAAHKSLKLLQAAKPEDPIFSAKSASNEISWIWTEENIKNLWNGIEIDNSSATLSPHLLQDGDSSADDLADGRDLASQFRIFDLEPGCTSSLEHDFQAVLDEHMVNFPSVLPHIAPSPSLLCEVMFSPLHDQASALSRALLAVFLDRSSFLCIDAHLELLRSHMLLTSHSFKSRLSAALFSDAEDKASQCMPLYNLLRLRSKGSTLPDQPHASRWPVGLAPLLSTRDSWPPGGSELSFLLRTVIVDSRRSDPPEAENTALNPDRDGTCRVMNEAESRLGFAIRELGDRGHERWLDPLSIEALDFLYLDYKVPHPLQTLIPTTVLSKYQRMFALLLRLTRVECAIRSVFRLTRAVAIPLFPTLSSSRGLLLHFRFVAHTFLSAFSTYIYDTAIGGNFDAFLSRIKACRETPDAPSSFRDVFALANCHSSVMDDILTACLLRSSQRATGDLLRGILEAILEFCVLVGDLKDGRMAEYQASPVLEALYASFRKKVATLIRTLEAMLDKHGRSGGSDQFLTTYPERDSRVPPGGLDSLRCLLTSLNQNNWWVKTR